MFRLTDICAAKSEETKAFAEEYSANMFDDDAEFAHLKEDRMEVDLDDEEESEDEVPVPKDKGKGKAEVGPTKEKPKPGTKGKLKGVRGSFSSPSWTYAQDVAVCMR